MYAVYGLFKKLYKKNISNSVMQIEGMILTFTMKNDFLNLLMFLIEAI